MEKYWGAAAIVGKETGSNGCEGITYQPMTSTPNIIDDGGGGTVNYGVQASANDIIMMAVDLSAATSKIWWGKNGTWFNAPCNFKCWRTSATGANPGLSFAKGDEFWGPQCYKLLIKQMVQTKICSVILEMVISEQQL